MKRDERVTFQEFSSASNDYGESTKTWSNLSTDPTMWASVKPMTGREDWSGDQKHGFQRSMINVLYRNDISTSMRVSWDNKYWDIRSINANSEGNRHESLDIVIEWREGRSWNESN